MNILHAESKDVGDRAEPTASKPAKRNGALTIGGQAVIEGVMMRSPNRISLAVRRPDGEITVEGWQFKSLTKGKKFLGLPIIRGAVNLAEMLYWGIKTLQLSAQIASGEEAQTPSKQAKFWSVVSLVIGLAIGVALFAYLPLFAAGLLGFRENPLMFNASAGIVRALLFMGYLIAISFMRDVKRLFQYHGAEHRTIFAFERGQPLVTERVQRFSTFHPRCGTSFILIVAVTAIFLFAAFDGIAYALWGFAPKPMLRLPVHLLFLPAVAGVSYEALKLSDKLSRRNILGRFLVAPGLWLQRITTKPPENDMVEVAVAALMDSIKDIAIGEGK